LNREDARIAGLGQDIADKDVRYFGLSDDLLPTFPSDDSLRGAAASRNLVAADVVLTSFSDQKATFEIDEQPVTTPLKLTGIYNVFNAAAALALVRVIMGDKLNSNKLIQALSNVTPAFGRGETFMIHGQPLELVLVKNPSGFRLSLQSFSPENYATMIAVNDDYADGRDMSWLWDVDFSSLEPEGVAQVSGVRGYDMALRLQYDDVPVESVQIDLENALKEFISDNKTRPKRIYSTYTAMLYLRRQISKLTKVERIG
jgi:UDP-N-acetylmuramyl tripeptide synthase